MTWTLFPFDFGVRIPRVFLCDYVSQVLPDSHTAQVRFLF